MADDVIKFEAVSVAIKDLEAAYIRKEEASEDFKALALSVAEASGLEPAVVKSYIAARMKDRTAKDRKKAEQLQLCFDTLGA